MCAIFKWYACVCVCVEALVCIVLRNFQEFTEIQREYRNLIHKSTYQKYA